MSSFQLRFLGAAGEVTGSSTLLETGRVRVLFDCGLYQGDRDAEARNEDEFAFDPKRLDAVVLTHAHIDHSGRLPRLVSQGYRGPIYTHEATKDLLRIMLRDAAFLAEKDAELESRRRARQGRGPVEPLFTIKDVASVLRRIKPIPYDQKVSIAPGVSLRMVDAGHILGSSVSEVWVEAQGTTRKIVFSGDLGHCDAPLLRDPSVVTTADLVIMESTYGDRDHRPWSQTYEEIGEIVGGAKATRGNILIPTFAVGRAQELLYLFARNYKAWNLKQWEIFLDSPMAIEATEVYARHLPLLDKEAAEAARSEYGLFDLPNLHLTRTASQSMRINTIRSGAIILAGSGMCTGGRIRHHIKHNIWNADNHMMVVGFQARGTLGRRLVDGAENIRLWGEDIKVAARIHTIGGLSAHAGASELRAWFRHFDGRPALILNHGESEASLALQESLERDFGTKASIAALGGVYDLAALRWTRRSGAKS